METKKKKVLIAVDYDPTAQKVADAGLSLAKSMGADVILLHIISRHSYYYLPEYSPVMGLSDALISYPLRLEGPEELAKAAQGFLDKTKHHLGDENIQTVIKEGGLSETILSTAKEMKVDIIVMGSHSRKWLEKIVMGSVTENVLNRTHLPLFIVPTKSDS